MLRNPIFASNIDASRAVLLTEGPPLAPLPALQKLFQVQQYLMGPVRVGDRLYIIIHVAILCTLVCMHARHIGRVGLGQEIK